MPQAGSQDVNEVLAFINDHSAYYHAIDKNRIGFLGHSSRGATALLLAGLSMDLGKMGLYCTTASAGADRGCDYAKNQPSRSPTASIVVGMLSPDFTVRAFVALDPAMGLAFITHQQRLSDAHWLIIASPNNDFLPFEHHAKRVAHLLPEAQTLWLSSDVGHFVYLNECRRDLYANGVPLYQDRTNLVRSAVHAQLQSRILAFLNTNLDPEMSNRPLPR